MSADESRVREDSESEGRKTKEEEGASSFALVSTRLPPVSQPVKLAKSREPQAREQISKLKIRMFHLMTFGRNERRAKVSGGILRESRRE
jgi:hypothetical protein